MPGREPLRNLPCSRASHGGQTSDFSGKAVSELDANAVSKEQYDRAAASAHGQSCSIAPQLQGRLDRALLLGRDFHTAQGGAEFNGFADERKAGVTYNYDVTKNRLSPTSPLRHARTIELSHLLTAAGQVPPRVMEDPNGDDASGAWTHPHPQPDIIGANAPMALPYT